jgi:AraC family transcriptional regulator of adaptative response / DNA-3-methyladenine glycosylase II
VHTDVERCLRAVRSKDARFDGWFVTAVVTTGIYCRPSCPVRPPHDRNMRFYPTAAAAQPAGFRACKRCRPDASPGSPEWNVRGDVVARAMRLIADGTVERDGVGGLARRLGYSTRQIERHLLAEVGAGPLALARSQRAQTARTLIETTDLPVSDIAFAAGFSSIRQFNDTIRKVFDSSPTALRARSRRGEQARTKGTVSLRLPYRRPFDPVGLFGHLAATAVPGCEEMRGTSLRRTLRLANGSGIVSLTPADGHIACDLALDDIRDLPSAIARCRRLLDLDADPEAIAEALGTDPHLAESVRRTAGKRVPRGIDGPETALRIVLGQQVSTAAAATHAGRLAERLGLPIDDPGGGLTRVFPDVKTIAALDPRDLALPRRRAECLIGLAAALAEGSVDLEAGADWDVARTQLAALPGIGPWTVELIAMRALGDPDAFCPTDLGIRRGAAALRLPEKAGALAHHAARWRPWRAYAAQELWAALDHPINRWPPST